MIRFFFHLVLTLSVLLPAAVFADFPVRSTGVVEWVADGDTFRFKADNSAAFSILRQAAEDKDKATDRDLRVEDRFHSDGSFLVRLSNVDTAESKHPDASRNTKAGEEAAAYVKALIEGKNATIECYEVGYWGRAICSLWTDEFELGTHLISRHYSDYLTRYGRHPRLDSEYRQAMFYR